MKLQDFVKTKAETSADYIRTIKAIHGNKPIPDKRHAIVIGCAKDNIGDAIVRRLLELQCNTIMVDRASCDLRKPDDLTKILQLQPYCDTLILCNGMMHLDWIEHQPLEEIEEVVSCSLTASIIGASGFVRSTLHKPFHKHLVFIGSMAHRMVLNGSAPYCAAKAGLAHLTRCLGWELAPKGYSVFCVHPGNTEGTPMTEQTIQELMAYRNIGREQAERYWGANNLQPRWLQAKDVAETVTYLISGRARHQTGTNIELSGGQR